MTSRPQRDTQGFFLGLMTGGIVGAGVAMLFAPRLVVGLRQRVAGSATRVPAILEGFTTGAEAVRDDVADAVGRGARQVEQFAAASKKRKRSQS